MIGNAGYAVFQIYEYDYYYQQPAIKININQCLPQNYKQQDFINDIIHFMNLYVVSDRVVAKKIYLYLYSEFYNTTNPLVWTNNIEDSSIQFQDLNLTLPEEFDFNFASGDDIYNKDYNQQFNTPVETVNMNSMTLLNPKDLASTDTFDYSLTTPSTAIISVSPQCYIPKLYDGSSRKDYGARLLFLNWQPQSPVVNLFAPYSGGTVSNILTVTNYQKFNVSDPTNLNITFDSNVNTYLDQALTLSNYNLYNAFYKQDLESKMYGGEKLLCCNALLKPQDLAGNLFQQLIYIEHKYIGNSYYHLNAIKNWNGSNDLTPIELIKINPNYVAGYSPTISPNIIELLPTSTTDAETNSSNINNSTNNANSGVNINLNWINVKDYGAKGDGSTNDTQAIQAAITATSGNTSIGTVLFFPVGIYIISTGLVGASNMTFQGVSRELSTLQTIASGDGATFGNGSVQSTHMLWFQDCQNVIIKDLGFVGVSINGASSQAIWFDLLNAGNTNNVHIDNILVNGHASEAAIFINTPILSSISNSEIVNIAGHCIWVENGTSFSIRNTYAITATQAGFLFQGMTYCTLDGCAAENVGVGYDFTNCTSIVCNGCGTEIIANQNDTNDKYKYGEIGYGTFKIGYDARSFRSTNSEVQLNSCYSRDPGLMHISGYFDIVNFHGKLDVLLVVMLHSYLVVHLLKELIRHFKIILIIHKQI